MAKVTTGLQRNWRGKAGSYVFQKNGKQTIARERVDQVKNPQTNAQMLQRVVFATVTQAADKLLPIIGISQQGVTDEVESRRRWISQNVKLLRESANRMSRGGAVEAAFAPKGNGQLIPNSYQISKGSLSLPSVLAPRTNGEGGASFDGTTFDEFDASHVFPYGEYNGLDLWREMFGVLPNDQLTFPQIYAEGHAQTLYGANGAYVDLTRYTSFCAPRLVLRDTADSITIGAGTTEAEIIAALASAVDTDLSWYDIENVLAYIVTVQAGENNSLTVNCVATYDEVWAVNDDDYLVAIGCIRSHKNVSNGKWEYSTSRLVCRWGEGGKADAVGEYFGFTLRNAIDTYLANVTMDGEGNFLQTGTDAQIVPESFM